MAAQDSKRILIVGGTGFVGPFLIEELRRRRPEDTLLATGKVHLNRGQHSVQLDVTNRADVLSLLRDFRPDTIVHMAAISTFAASTKNPDIAWQVNLHGTRHVGESALEILTDVEFIHISSGEVYGRSCNIHDPVGEDARLDPSSVYAASKAAGDIAIGELAGRGLRAIRLRPFNHTGIGQPETLFVPSIAGQIARAEAGLQEPKISVGNLDARRDFLDVRDVVKAYVNAIDRFSSLRPGSIFNIASGVSQRMGDILQTLLSQAKVTISTQPDPQRMRPSEVPAMRGNAYAARQALRWSPMYSLDTTLTWILNHMRDGIPTSQTDGSS